MAAVLGAGAVAPQVAAAEACNAEPRNRTTAAGVTYVRTPDRCFANLTKWPYRTRYVEIDGLRQAYVDAGPKDADPILLLHGQPSWSYLYRHMIPGLVARGHRIIAMDNLGMGRSDKPVNPRRYTFDVHAKRLDRFATKLRLQDVTLFAQDWGSIIGLWDAASRPDRYSRIVIGNGGIPEDPQRFSLPPAGDPSISAFGRTLRSVPAQQQPFFDADGNLLLPGSGSSPAATTPASGGANPIFSQWAGYAYRDTSFKASTMLEALTYRDLSPSEEAAYDAPFPRREYMAGPRTFPSLVNDLVGRTAARRTALTKYRRPFLTIFGGNDPGLVGAGDDQAWMTTRIPGAARQPHHRYADASHFLQEDKGADIARRVDSFIAASTDLRGRR